jgi:tetratricopeptide (TPR) repeat protein
VSSGKSRHPILSVIYEQYLENQDSTAFVNKVSKRYSPGTLERLARHEHREVRRAAVLALGFVGDYDSNHTMGRALFDDDRTVRMLAENGIRSIWTRAGSEEQRRALRVIIHLNATQQYEEAARRASRLAEKAPWFAEVWNQRAIAQFNLGHFTESIRDCHQALEINPYHFVAAAGMGQAYLELENFVSALESFRRALRLNPDLEAVRVQVVRLARMVEDKQ